MTRRAPRPLSALRDFLASEAAGGLVLMAAAALALIVANLPGSATFYQALLERPIGPAIGEHGTLSVRAWINDGLMALFFLLVGLEIKREVIDGQLAKPSHRRLPVIAAAAGMIAPALVFLAVTGGDRSLSPGWAIPCATDIAFAIGVLALLGKRVPSSLKLFLTTVAIVDDIGAVAIIALVYTAHLNLFALAAATGVAAAMALIGRAGVVRLWPYCLGFAAMWLFVLLSGVHATIAGVVSALLIPVRRSPGAPDDAGSPLHRLEHALHPWVAYAIVPLFGFANAGVALAGSGLKALADPLVLGIAAGLFLGKQSGVFGAIWVADRMGLARRPRGASWAQLYGVALLAGIGFTMSLFIGALAFPGSPALADTVRIGVLAGSLASALAGAAVLGLAGRKPNGAAEAASRTLG